MVISLQAGRNSPLAGQISLQYTMVSLCISLFFPLQITKFSGKELLVLPAFSQACQINNYELITKNFD